MVPKMEPYWYMTFCPGMAAHDQICSPPWAHISIFRHRNTSRPSSYYVFPTRLQRFINKLIGRPSSVYSQIRALEQ